MRLHPLLAVSAALFACAAASSAGPLAPQPDVVFSMAADQWIDTDEGGGLLFQQNAYAATADFAPVAAFLPAFVGLGSIDVAGDGTVFFVVEHRGLVAHAGGLIELQEGPVYRFEPASGAISSMLDWSTGGVDPGTIDALDWPGDGAVVFSTTDVRYVGQPGGGWTLRPENVYRYEPATGLLELMLDGIGSGLPNVDAVAVLSDGSLAFSTDKNVFVATDSGGQYLRHENAYVFTDGGVKKIFDGVARGLSSLDALAVADASLRLDRAGLHWLAGGAGGHDVVRGDLGALLLSGGDFSVAVIDCLAAGHTESFLLFPYDPDPGTGFWFLVRQAPASGPGTYDTAGAGQVAPRDAAIAASGADCTP
jgi:hypothetical protein